MTSQRLKLTSLIAILFAVFCMAPAFPALASSSSPTIAVGPFSSAGKTKQKRMQATRARTAISKALGASGNAELLSWTTVTNKAKRQYVTGAALEKPSKVGPVVKKLGGDALVFGKIDKNGRLTLTVTDTKGKNLWVKTVPLKKGVVSPQLAKKFAKAIVAAAEASSSKKPDKKKGASKKQGRDRDEESESLDEADEEAAPKASKPEKKASSSLLEEEEETDEWGRPKNQRKPADDVSESSHSERKSSWSDEGGDGWGGGDRGDQGRNDRDRGNDSCDGDRGNDSWGGGSGNDSWSGGSGNDSWSGGSDDGYRPDGDIGPALVKINADLSLTFRKYKFCNGVTKCGDAPMEGAGHSIDFSTSTPYLGFRLGLELFPAAHVRNRYLRGIGLVGSLRMNPGVKVSYTLGGQETELSGKEVDFDIEATYRFYYSAGFLKNGWIGLELGYMRYGFTIDENPLFSSSSHGGFAIGLDAGFPLHRYVALDLNFTFQPSTSPGDDERAFFAGSDKAAGGVAGNGKGLKFDVGLEFPFSRYIGVNVKFDFARYWSSFERYKDSASDTVIPATASEQYIGISFGLTGKF